MSLLHVCEHFIAPERFEVTEFTWCPLAFMVTLDVIVQIGLLAEGLCTLVAKVPAQKKQDIDKYRFVMKDHDRYLG